MGKRTRAGRFMATTCALVLAGLMDWSLAAGTGGAVAAELPQSFTASGTRARKQSCYTTFTVDAEGSWRANTRFTNRRRLHGDYFEAVFRLVDDVGNVMVAIKHGAHVRGRFPARHSKTVWVYSSGQIDPLSVPLHGVSVEYSCGGHGHVPDHEILGTLVRFIHLL